MEKVKYWTRDLDIYGEIEVRLYKIENGIGYYFRYGKWNKLDGLAAELMWEDYYDAISEEEAKKLMGGSM
jgi:hypothetical protein